MSKRRGHLANLASLFAGSDSDDDSDYADDATIASNETGGDSLFDLLSLASEDDLDIYGQVTGRDGDDSDDASETTNFVQKLVKSQETQPVDYSITCFL